MLAPAANILLRLVHIAILWCCRPRSSKAILQSFFASLIYFLAVIILIVYVALGSSNNVATTISLCVHSTIHLLSPFMLIILNGIKKEKLSLLVFFSIFLYFTVFISILVTLSGLNKEAAVSNWDDTTNQSYISVIKLIFVALQLPINSLVYFLVFFPIMPHCTIIHNHRNTSSPPESNYTTRLLVIWQLIFNTVYYTHDVWIEIRCDLDIATTCSYLWPQQCQLRVHRKLNQESQAGKGTFVSNLVELNNLAMKIRNLFQSQRENQITIPCRYNFRNVIHAYSHRYKHLCSTP